MRRLLAAAAALVVVAVAAGLVLVLRGPGPEDVVEDYLAAYWRGDGRTQCAMSTEQWRHYLYEGQPFADCDEYARAARKAAKGGPLGRFRDDTRVSVRVEEVSEGDGKARVAYVVELDYRGEDRAGFNALVQGGGGVDRGTVELVDDAGEWRVAGVDAG